MNTQETVGRNDPEIIWEHPKKNKLRIMPISDSPWAPTGFGTNTKNIGCILHNEGHHIGYAGCQNPSHGKWWTPWPLGQTEKESYFELLPLMFQGEEKFGEKSFPHWLKNFKPDLILGHLDFQMFKYITDKKSPTHVQMPLYNDKGKVLNRNERVKLVNKAYNNLSKGQPWKLGIIIPFDGEPSIPSWQQQLDNIDYPVAMSRYGQQGLLKDFNTETTYIPHGVDINLFRPILNPQYTQVDKMGNRKDVTKPNAFVVGCVARNQHRKNLPRLIKGFAQFVKKNKLGPDEAKLLLHTDWEDYMGWKFPEFAAQYNVEKHLMAPTMHRLDLGEALSEEGMANLYNFMDVFVLPTAGEGFGIPTLEAMSCGIPICVTNYTTGWELVRSKDPEHEDIPMYPLGGSHNDPTPNGRDYLEPEDYCERGILLPYKDMW